MAMPLISEARRRFVNGLDPATAIFVAADGRGYWIATALGKVFTLATYRTRVMSRAPDLERADYRCHGLVNSGPRVPLSAG